MKLMLDIDIKSPAEKVSYNDSIFLIGSCFTEHIGGRLAELKFPVLQNPNGILFDPLSVSKSIEDYVTGKEYTEDDLFQLNELWQSWQHHSIFSGLDKTAVLKQINASQRAAHQFVRTADWMIITLGSAFSYKLTNGGMPVANCHRAPGQMFNKHLVETHEIISRFEQVIKLLNTFNPRLKIIFTISPVRHIRDGVTENNRSKARLIEAVHHLTEQFTWCHYFPAYELVIDVLRDYRFYDIDLVHPNYAATEFVFTKFKEHFVQPETARIMDEVKQLVTAYNHKPFQPDTNAHKAFLSSSLAKAEHLQARLPKLDFSREIAFFGH